MAVVFSAGPRTFTRCVSQCRFLLRPHAPRPSKRVGALSVVRSSNVDRFGRIDLVDCVFVHTILVCGASNGAEVNLCLSNVTYACPRRLGHLQSSKPRPCMNGGQHDGAVAVGVSACRERLRSVAMKPTRRLRLDETVIRSNALHDGVRNPRTCAALGFASQDKLGSAGIEDWTPHSPTVLPRMGPDEIGSVNVVRSARLCLAPGAFPSTPSPSRSGKSLQHALVKAAVVLALYKISKASAPSPTIPISPFAFSVPLLSYYPCLPFFHFCDMGSDGAVIEYDASGHIISPFYGYLPSDPANKTFLILFVVTTLLHLAQATRARAWWLLPTVVLAGVGEILGWAARTWSFYKPLNSDAYLMQTVALVIAPTPLIGALFITFGRLSGKLGLQYSRISPRLYSRIFLTSDCVALLVQAVGGGIAASSDDRSVSRMGSNIMLGGIVFQLVSLSIFCFFMGEYLVRRLRNKPLRKAAANNSVDTLYNVSEESFIEKSLLRLAFGLCAETLFLYIRGVYRVIELADGWHGKVIQTQSLFIVFDGVMVLLTMLCLNVFHPGQLSNTKPRSETSSTELKVPV